MRISEILRKAASGQLHSKRRTYLIYTVRFKSRAPIGPAWSVSGAAKLIYLAVLDTLPISARRLGCGKHISMSALERGQIVPDRSGRVKFRILNQREIALEPASFGI